MRRRTVVLQTMGAADNGSSDDGIVDDACRRQLASPNIGLRKMGPLTKGPQVVVIANMCVADGDVANNGAADDARR